MSTDIVEMDGAALDDLARQINVATTAAEASARAAVEHALVAGRLLIEAKALLQHGQWEAWLQQHCAVAPRTARAYMQLCNKVPTLPEPERQRVASLPLREAIAAISTSATPPPSPPRYRIGHGLASTARPSLESAARSLRNLASDVGLKSIKADRIKAMRTKLQAAMDALDAIEASGTTGAPG